MTAKEKLLKIVEAAKGDDLERTENAFRYSNLNDLFGQSGQTKGQVLDAYRKERQEWQAAYNLVKSL